MAAMRRRALPSLLVPALALLAAPVSAQTASPTTVVEVIEVEGPIDRPLLGFVLDRLDLAEDEGAVVVLQLDTPGSLNEDAVSLADRVANLETPVLAWIGPAPSKASGAGLLLMLAADVAAVYPGSQTGPLHPLDVAHPDRRVTGLDERIAGWLAAQGREADLRGADRPLTGQEAVDRGIASFGAASVKEVLDRVDGTTVRTATGPVVLSTRLTTTGEEAGTVTVRFDSLGPVRRVQHAVSTPTMVYVLLVLGLAGLAFELTQPGFGFAGFAGALLLALAIYGLSVVPASPLGFALLVGGVASMILDVRLRRLGPLTTAGLVAFVAGSALAWRGVAEAIRISPWWIVGLSLGSLLYYGFALTVAIQSRDRVLSTQRGLVGLVGEARGRLAPDGPVFVKGSLWRGRSTDGEIPAGARVRVRGVDGLILRVSREPEEEGNDPQG
jgi:membrane-bound serine protease (ClpP class)